jgi:hypothetical protein
MVWWARPGEVIIRGRLPAVAIVSAAVWSAWRVRSTGWFPTTRASR